MCTSTPGPSLAMAVFGLSVVSTCRVLPPVGCHQLLRGSSTDDTLLAVGLRRKQLRALWQALPVAPPSKPACSDRSYFCDTEGWVRAGMRRCLLGAKDEKEETSVQGAAEGGGSGLGVAVSTALPHTRFLCYRRVGGYLVPHIDLSRTDASGRTSTHTFLLYLDDCAAGGETVRVL